MVEKEKIGEEEEKFVKIYTKPYLVQTPLECVKWPRCVIERFERPEIAWTSLSAEKTSFSKSVVVYADKETVWNLVSDPNKFTVFDDGIIDVDWPGGDTFVVKDVYKAGTGAWKTQYFEEKIIEKNPPDMIRYEIDRKGHKEQFTYKLENGGEKDKTILTMQFDANFAIENHRELEDMMEKMCFNIARFSTDKEKFARLIKEFHPTKEEFNLKKSRG